MSVDAEPTASNGEDSPLQGYFDWQVTTLMLSLDLVDPLPADVAERDVAKRRGEIEAEVRAFTLELVPEDLKQDPSRAWPPELLRAITRETIRRAEAICARAGEDPIPSPPPPRDS